MALRARVDGIELERAKIEGHLASIDGVCEVRGSVLNPTLTVTIDEGYLDDAEVRSEVGRLGYLAQSIEESEREAEFTGTWSTPPPR